MVERSNMAEETAEAATSRRKGGPGRMSREQLYKLLDDTLADGSTAVSPLSPWAQTQRA